MRSFAGVDAQLTLEHDGLRVARFEDLYLPDRPLCSNKKNGGYRRRSQAAALDYTYIETNPRCMQRFLVFDCDHDEPTPLQLPPPSWKAATKTTGRYHAAYALTRPVCTSDWGRYRVLKFLADIEETYAHAYDADLSYTGRIMKNPFSSDFWVDWGENFDPGITLVYSLRELMSGARAYKRGLSRVKRDVIENSGFGRNVALFETVRRWSYRHRGDYRTFNDFANAVYDLCYEINERDFTYPLPGREAATVAGSIAGWTWSHILRPFADEQARRGRRTWTKQLEQHGSEYMRAKMRDRGAIGGKMSTNRKVNSKIFSQIAGGYDGR